MMESLMQLKVNFTRAQLQRNLWPLLVSQVQMH